MTQATITSYTLLDFISEGDMNLFFSFIEEHRTSMPPGCARTA